MSTSPKSFVWYELMTTDMEAAEAFYRSVVGWTAQPWGQPGMPYTVMNAGSRGVAGLMELPAAAREAGLRPAWVGYIAVDDVDTATGGIKRAGGSVHRAPADIPEVGRFAVVADPQGAMFMLLTPAGEDNAPAPPGTLGHVGWRELHTSDWPGALEFYAGQFGWTKADAMDMGPMGTYQLFAAGAEPIGGMMNKSNGAPSSMWLFYFIVPEADAAAARVSERGGQVLSGPHQVPGGGWIVRCLDPQGALFALLASRR